MFQSLRRTIRDFGEGLWASMSPTPTGRITRTDRQLAQATAPAVAPPAEPVITPAPEAVALVDRVLAKLKLYSWLIPDNVPYTSVENAHFMARRLDNGQQVVDVWSAPRYQHVAAIGFDELGTPTIEWTDPELTEDQVATDVALAYLKARQAPMQRGERNTMFYADYTLVAHEFTGTCQSIWVLNPFDQHVATILTGTTGWATTIWIAPIAV